MKNVAVSYPFVAGGSQQSGCGKPAVTVAEAVDLFFIGYTGRDVGITSRMAWWVQQIGHHALLQLSDEHVFHALESLRATPKRIYVGGATGGRGLHRDTGMRKGSTINRYHATLGTLFKFCRKKRLVPRDWRSPLQHIERDPESPGKLRYLSEQEYDRLLITAKAALWPKLRALVMLAVTTGARSGSLMGLTWNDVDFERGEALIDRTKNETPFVLTLTPEVIAELKPFSQGMRPDALVFCGRWPNRRHHYDKGLRNAMEVAGIKGATFHTLRHSHASWLARKGASLVQIAESMNHKTLAMVKRYAHLCVDDRRRMIMETFSAKKKAA
jgi:integrase